MLAIHARILPLDRKRTLIINVIQRTQNLLEIHTPMTERTEVPITAHITKLQMSAKHATHTGRRIPPHILHVRMENAIAEVIKEPHIVNTLIRQMTRVIIEPKTRVIIQCLQRLLARDKIKRDFRRMHLERKLDATSLELIQNRKKTRCKLLVAIVNHMRRHCRERVEQMPDGTARESIDDINAQRLGGTSGHLHILRGTLTHALGITVTPHLGSDKSAMTLINPVTNRLTNKMIANGKNLQPKTVETRTPLLDIIRIRRRRHDIKVIAPAARLHAVITKLDKLLAQNIKRKVSPLTRKNRNRSIHNNTLIFTQFRRKNKTIRLEEYYYLSGRKCDDKM